MSEYIHKKHNVSVLIYHIVCPAKYRKVIFSKEVDIELKNICLEIGKRYEIKFIEIGTDQNHVHFLVQSVPMQSPTQIVKTIKSITAREVLKKCPEVKKVMWGGKFWSEGFFINTVGHKGCEETVRKYVKEQGVEKEYVCLHNEAVQLSLF
jgi:REP element-mobilizing transposase RayT